jgi:hypothetical protein
MKSAKFLRSRALRLSVAAVILLGTVAGSVAIWLYGSNTLETVSWFWAVVAGFAGLVAVLVPWAAKKDDKQRPQLSADHDRGHLVREPAGSVPASDPGCSNLPVTWHP